MRQILDTILTIFRNAIKSPKTTATGCAMIAAAVISVIHDPASIGTLPPWLGFFGGLGLICAPDAVKQMVPIVVLLLVAAPSAQAQVSVQYSPEPMAVLGALNVKSVGIWSVRACNDGTQLVSIPEERIYMAAPAAIHLITPDRARSLVLASVGKTKKARAAEYIGYGLMIATPLVGFGPVAASKTVIASLGLATGVAAEFRQQFQSQTPDLSPFFGNILQGTLSLSPASCTTRTAFAAKMKNPQPVFAKIP